MQRQFCEMPQRQHSMHIGETPLPLEAPPRPAYLELAPSTMDAPMSLPQLHLVLFDACVQHGLSIRPSKLWSCGFTISSLILEPLEPLEPFLPTQLSVAIFQADDGPGLQIEVRPVHDTPDYPTLADELSNALGLHFRGGALVMRPKK
jgi:hypothetical protein